MTTSSSDRTGAAIVVFGKPSGHRSPQGGCFPTTLAQRAASIADKAGLSVLRLDNEELQLLDGQLARGAFGKGHRLRLRTISAKLATALHAMQRSQLSQRRQLAQAGPDQVSSNNSHFGTEAPAVPPGGGLNAGEEVLAAYRLLDQVGNWIQRLAVEFAELLERVGKSGDFSVGAEAEEPEMDGYYGGAEWVCNGWRWSYPVRRRRHRLGTLSLVADIGRPGRAAAGIGQPVMTLSWSSAVHNWNRDIDSASEFWPPPTATVGLCAECLFYWIGPSGNGPAEHLPLRDNSWFFIMPLRAFQTLAQVRTLLVQPTFALLGGSQVEKAFAATPEILRFERKGAGVKLVS